MYVNKLKLPVKLRFIWDIKKIGRLTVRGIHWPETLQMQIFIRM